MNCPDKIVVFEKNFDVCTDKDLAGVAMLCSDGYEAAIKHQIEVMEIESARLKVMVSYLQRGTQLLEIEKIDLVKLNIRLLEMVEHKHCTECKVEQKNVDLTVENNRLREALRPFAEAFEPRTNVDQDVKMQKAFDRNLCTPQMTMGCFRKAAEVLERKRQ